MAAFAYGRIHIYDATLWRPLTCAGVMYENEFQIQCTQTN